MSIPLKQKDYWKQFTSYQTFTSIKDLNTAVRKFESIYDLTDAIKAVLNTIKLHSKQIFGVCWLRKEKIAQKAKVSLSSVDRAIKGLKETGFLKVVAFNHTKFGRQTHNVYILNPNFDVPEEVHSVVPDDVPLEVPNEVAQKTSEESETPVVPTVCEPETQPYKNSHTNSNKTLKDNTSIKRIPNEFLNLMKPFYANDQEIIRARWKTVCVAAKKSCEGIRNVSWDLVGQAWKDTVSFLKRGRIKNSSDDGIGGYFYGVLCDYLMDNWLRSQLKTS